jgi:phosphomannomutase
MSEPIISVSGLRGIIGTELTPATVVRYISAFCSTLPAGPVVVSRDGRESGMMLKHAAISTLLGHGKSILDADVTATPTVGVLVRALSATAGIQITASHNPRAYNGIKLFDQEGRVIPQVPGVAVRDAYLENRTAWKSIDGLGQYTAIENPHEGHLQKLCKIVDIEKIRRRKFKVLLDSNHGSGSTLGTILLERLGCEVTVLGATPDGQFAHPPEPVAQNLISVSEMVRQGSYDVGFCQDPDADRLAIIDANGHYIGEEFTAVLCMLNALEMRQNLLMNDANAKIPSDLVINCASSSMSQWLAGKFGVKLFRTKVGEANVVDAMINQRALYGGEGSGGPIDPRIGWVRDSFVGMASVLDLLARRGQGVSDIVNELPQMFMVKDKIELGDLSADHAVAAIQSRMAAPQISTLDGLRLDWPDAWLLIRGSNTEPIIRFICEAESLDRANELIDQAKKIVGT